MWTCEEKRVVEPVRANIEWKWPFLKLGGSVWPKISGRRGRPSPTILCVRKTTWIYLSCGIRISAELPFVLSQFTRVTDRRTDRQTDTFAVGKTALHVCSAVKTRMCRSTDWKWRGEVYCICSTSVYATWCVPNRFVVFPDTRHL